MLLLASKGGTCITIKLPVTDLDTSRTGIGGFSTAEHLTRFDHYDRRRHRYA